MYLTEGIQPEITPKAIIDEPSLANPRVPAELYSIIIWNIEDNNTLLSLLVSSKHVSREVLPKLYYSFERKDAKSHTLFLKTVLDTKRTYLSGFVHHYYVPSSGMWDYSEICDLIARALPTFVNLKNLCWRPAGSSAAMILPIKEPCSFQLHTFKWFHGQDESTLGPFLSTQHSLEVLSMYFNPENFSIPATALRNLQSLTGTDYVITKILPGRESITHVHMEPFCERFRLDTMTSASFSNVRIFSFGTRGLRPPLGSMVPFLEYIEILELGQYRGSERDALFSLKNLRTLVLTWYYYDQDPNDILAHMERLERIDYGIHSEMWGLGYDPTQYERCDRGSQETSIVPASEVRWWQGAEEQWWEPNNLNKE